MTWIKIIRTHLLVLTLSSGVLLWGNLGLAESVCPKIEARGEVKPAFTEGEKLLLCGKPSLQGGEFQAWAEVPLSQAAIHLQAFLQSRGYLNPKIELEKDRLVFTPGAIVKVSQVDSKGGPSGFDISRRRNTVDKPLTPSLLSETENWTKSEMERAGYPCPRAQAAAEAQTGKILVQVDPGEKQNFGDVLPAPGPEGFNSQNLTRYYAFKPDEEYNQTLLQVSEDRTITEGIVEQTKFIPNCTVRPAAFQQTYVLGEPRILSFSFMASTEVIAQIQAGYRKTRMDSKASFFDANLTVSARLQELTAYYNWYLQSGESAAVRPLVTFRHQDEHPFAMDTEQAQVFYMNHWDFRQGFGVNWDLGPSFSFFQMRRGPLDGQERKALALESHVELQSFQHELYRRNIFSGFRVRLGATTQSKEAGSDFAADTVKFDSEVLSNLTDDTPPTWMGAWRISGATTSSPDPANLPPSYRQYLGGIETLRGFDRLQIPTANEGALTRLSTSLEVRTAKWSETIWPLAFVDFGWMGTNSYQIQGPTYRSPGVGVHWKSPLGPLRATIAQGQGRGDATDPSKVYNQWQIYASLGERF